MRLEDLALFRDIARERSVTRGAALHKLTQSAASQHLREIEEKFKVTLLDRTRRPLVLTRAGKAYLEFCLRVLHEQEQLESTLGSFREAIEGKVRFATIYSVGLSEVQSLRETFKQRAPAVELAVEYLRPEKIYEAVRADRADLGLVSYPRGDRDLRAVLWRQEEMVIALAPAHPLATMASLHATHLEGQKFVAFDAELPIQKHIERFFREEKVSVNTVLHLDNIDSIREAVAHGSGVSLVPKPSIRTYVEQGRLVGVPLAPRSPKRPLGIIYRRKKKFLRAADEFLKLLLERSLPPVGRT